MGPYPQETADLAILTVEILNGKLHSLCNVNEIAENLHSFLRKQLRQSLL